MAEVQVTYKKSRLTPGAPEELSRTISVGNYQMMAQDQQRQQLAAAFAAADPKPNGQEPSGHDNEEPK